MVNIEKIINVWKMYKLGVPKKDIAKRFGLSRETVGIWVKSVQSDGLLDFLKKYSRSKKVPRLARQTLLTTKKLIWRIKREENVLKAKEIQKILKRKYRIILSLSKIYEILGEGDL